MKHIYKERSPMSLYKLPTVIGNAASLTVLSHNPASPPQIIQREPNNFLNLEFYCLDPAETDADAFANLIQLANDYSLLDPLNQYGRREIFSKLKAAYEALENAIWGDEQFKEKLRKLIIQEESLLESSFTVRPDPLVYPNIPLNPGEESDYKIVTSKSTLIDQLGNKITVIPKGSIVKQLIFPNMPHMVVSPLTHTYIGPVKAMKHPKIYPSFHQGYIVTTALHVTTLLDTTASYEYRNLPDSVPLFEHDPTIDDIRQGGLGDCYLMAAMAGVILRRPEHFKTHMRDDNQGNVHVLLYKAVNNPIVITIKKSTVYKKSTSLMKPPSFKQAYAQDIPWVALYEKAYVAAGFWGNEGTGASAETQAYGTISNGLGSIAITHITGEQTFEDTITNFTARSEALGKLYTITKNLDSVKQYHGIFLQAMPFLPRVQTHLDDLNYDISNLQEDLSGLDPRYVKAIVKEIKKQHLPLFSKFLFLPNIAFSQLQQIIVKLEKTQPGILQAAQAFLPRVQFCFSRPDYDIKTFKQDLSGLPQNYITPILLEVQNQRLLSGPLGSGLYSDGDIALFQKLRSLLDSGKIIVVSTKKQIYDTPEQIERQGHSGGEPMVKGLVGGHSYTLIAYACPGSQLVFKLRNPWGFYGRSYVAADAVADVETQGVPFKATSREEKGNGEFWLELTELSSCFDSFSTN